LLQKGNPVLNSKVGLSAKIIKIGISEKIQNESKIGLNTVKGNQN